MPETQRPMPTSVLEQNLDFSRVTFESPFGMVPPNDHWQVKHREAPSASAARFHPNPRQKMKLYHATWLYQETRVAQFKFQFPPVRVPGEFSPKGTTFFFLLRFTFSTRLLGAFYFTDRPEAAAQFALARLGIGSIAVLGKSQCTILINQH